MHLAILAEVLDGPKKDWLYVNGSSLSAQLGGQRRRGREPRSCLQGPSRFSKYWK